MTEYLARKIYDDDFLCITSFDLDGIVITSFDLDGIVIYKFRDCALLRRLMIRTEEGDQVTLVYY